MAVLFSILLTMGCAYWFYRTAERLGSKAVHWGLAGAIAYQIPAWAWMMLVSRPYVAELRGAQRIATSAFLFGHTWLLVGIACAYGVYRFLLLKTNVRAESP